MVVLLLLTLICAVPAFAANGDVAGAVEYLTAPLASWTTGETLDLNGGYFMV